jgi:hypothetical protein
MKARVVGERPDRHPDGFAAPGAFRLDQDPSLLDVAELARLADVGEARDRRGLSAS